MKKIIFKVAFVATIAMVGMLFPVRKIKVTLRNLLGMISKISSSLKGV